MTKTKTINKIIVKDGCEAECEKLICAFNQVFHSKDVAEVVFMGTFDQCKSKAEILSNGTDRIMQHCWYSGGKKYTNEYINKKGYLIKGNQNEDTLCFIAQENTDSFLSYKVEVETLEQTIEDIIKKDKKTFRSSMLSRTIKKSPYRTE